MRYIDIYPTQYPQQIRQKYDAFCQQKYCPIPLDDVKNLYYQLMYIHDYERVLLFLQELVKRRPTDENLAFHLQDFISQLLEPVCDREDYSFCPIDLSQSFLLNRAQKHREYGLQIETEDAQFQLVALQESAKEIRKDPTLLTNQSYRYLLQEDLDMAYFPLHHDIPSGVHQNLFEVWTDLTTQLTSRN